MRTANVKMLNNEPNTKCK